MAAWNNWRSFLYYPFNGTQGTEILVHINGRKYVWGERAALYEELQRNRPVEFQRIVDAAGEKYITMGQRQQV